MIDKVIDFIQSHKGKIIVAVVLIGAAFIANVLYTSNRSYTMSSGIKLTLTAKECNLSNVLEAVTPQYKDQLKLVIVDVPAELAKRYDLPTQFKACALELDGQVVGMDEFGNMFSFDAKEFK